MINFKKIDHVQLCISPEYEEETRAFYAEVLGLIEIPKPESLLKNGGFWFLIGDIQLHIGIETKEKVKSKQHPAFEVTNIHHVKEYLISKQVKIQEDVKIPTIERFSFFDPYGNRIELLERIN